MGLHVPIADSVSDRRVAAALTLLHRNLGDHQLTLSAIAVSLSVSTSRLRHLLKLETGVCFREHLNKARVRAAAGYLFDTSLSVKEVAFLVGYYNIWALDRHFKAAFGCTPKVYRASTEKAKGAQIFRPTAM
jgi:transcriptional regulator GlxA family with amidase domain